MRITTERTGADSLPKRLAWFVGLWMAGVLSVAGVAIVLRLVMHAL